MSYLVLARKYRPQTFDELIGQEFITTTLKNAIALNRVSHAYLFTGARGVGKTSAARIMAKALNCLNPVDHNPCNVCEHCIEITDGQAIDVIEIDGASNRGIDEIRDLRERVNFTPTKYKRKIYIIDEVHMLTKEAFNALLKTLEEPPSYVVFIFATTDPQKILPTILSRCQRYDFKKIPFDEMKERIIAVFNQENVAFEQDAINLIVRHADGGMRDALSFCDQVLSYTSGKVDLKSVSSILGYTDSEIIDELFSALIHEDVSRIEELTYKLFDTGVKFPFATERLLTHTRNLLFILKSGSAVKKTLTSNEISYYEKLSKIATDHRIYALFQLLIKLATDIKYSGYEQYTFEFAMYKAASLSKLIPLPFNQQGETAAPSTATPRATAPSRDSYNQNIQRAADAEKYSYTSTPAANRAPASNLEKRWVELLGEFKSQSPIIAAHLQYATAQDITPTKVILTFQQVRELNYAVASKEENQKTLLLFLKRKLGDNITLEMKIAGDEKKKNIVEKKPDVDLFYEQEVRGRAANDPIIKRFLEEFNIKATEMVVIKTEEKKDDKI